MVGGYLKRRWLTGGKFRKENQGDEITVSYYGFFPQEISLKMSYFQLSFEAITLEALSLNAEPLCCYLKQNIFFPPTLQKKYFWNHFAAIKRHLTRRTQRKRAKGKSL